MRKVTSFVGAAAVGSGLLVVGAPAYADSTGNNGINALDDNNVSAVPVQVCNTGAINVGSILANVGSGLTSSSPQNVNCVDAPIVDHPQTLPTPEQSPAPSPTPTQDQTPKQQLPLAPQPVVVPGHHAVTG